MTANATTTGFLRPEEVDASIDQLAFDALDPSLRAALREHPLRLSVWAILNTLAEAKTPAERTYITQRLLCLLDDAARRAWLEAFNEGRA